MKQILHYYSPEGEYWKYVMGQKSGLHVFGYNSAESEPIWMKSGILWAKCWRLALTDFGRDPRSSDNLSEPIFCHVNNARFHRFPVELILRHLNTTTSIAEAVKTFGTEFWKFYHKGSFFQKTQKLLKKFPRLATSGRHNSAMITDAENSRPNGPLTGCLVSIFTVRIKSIRSLSLGCTLRIRSPPPNLFAILVTTYGINNVYISHPHATNHRRLLSHVTPCFLECSKQNSLFHMCGRWNKIQNKTFLWA